MYWDGKGGGFTQKTAELATKTAKERGIDYIVVASNTGSSVEHFLGSGLNIVWVTHVNGFKEAGKLEFDPEKKKELESKGVKVLTTTHALSGAERGLSRQFSGVYPIEIMAATLRMFGQGVKVGVEIATMALDAGLIPYGENVVAVGGTGKGADSAIIIRPEHASNILKTWISEIICKPR
jgi:hypothetical protein